MRLPWRRSDEPTVEEQIHHLSEQIEIHDAVWAATERRHEVLSVVENAADVAAATRSIASLLGVSSIGAIAVMDLQLRGLTQRDRARIAERREEMRAVLAQLRAAAGEEA